jgi:hypothetical protein
MSETVIVNRRDLLLVLPTAERGPDAVLRLLAGIVAVVTGDEERGKRCLEVLRVLHGRNDKPPPLT